MRSSSPVSLTALLASCRRSAQYLGPFRGIARSLGLSALIHRAYHRRLLRRGFAEVRIPGTKYRLRTATPDELIRAQMVDCGPEVPFLTRSLAVLNKDLTCVDVGANVGAFSLAWANATLDRPTAIHSFEPHPENCAALRTNISLNESHNRIRVHQVALGNSSGSMPLFVAPGAFAGGHSLVEAHTASTTRIDVPVFKGDQYFSQNEIRPGLLKIDVEGFEVEVLLGLHQTLRSTTLRHVFVEVHPGSLERLGQDRRAPHQLLEAAGLQSVWEQERGQEWHVHFARSRSS